MFFRLMITVVTVASLAFAAHVACGLGVIAKHERRLGSTGMIAYGRGPMMRQVLIWSFHRSALVVTVLTESIAIVLSALCVYLLCLANTISLSLAFCVGLLGISTLICLIPIWLAAKGVSSTVL